MLPELHYVVLWHEGIDEPHFDVMFESEPGGPLITWRSPRWPLEHRASLLQLPDHRQDYLTYEGPITGDRGRVQRVAAGAFEWMRRGKKSSVIKLLHPAPRVLLIDSREK